MIGGSRVVEPHDHIVNLYDDDEHLVASVTQFVSAALRAGDVALVVATQAHRDAIEVRLRREGIDCERSRKSGHYLPFDAAEMLSSISDGTKLDADRFEAAVGGLLDRLLAEGRRVRAFGEMVALLWEAGNVAGAIELEAAWNALARTREFSLYCAYPMASLAAGGDVTATSQLCAHHSYVLAPRSYESPRPSRKLVDDMTERSELFVPVVSAVAAARRFVRETLAAWGASDLAGDAMLIASELATNAVRHAGSAFQVTVGRTDQCVRITVADISPAPPARRDPSPAIPGGRGLAIVELLSVRWGSEARPDGKMVWADLARSRRPGPARSIAEGAAAPYKLAGASE